MASSSINIVLPGPERGAYPRPVDGRVRDDDVKAAAVGAVRPSPERSDARSTSSRTAGVGSDANRPQRTVIHPEPQGTLAFLAQQLAQDDESTSSGVAETDGDAPSSLRMSASRAYTVARDSTIEYLSPTPRYDFRV